MDNLSELLALILFDQLERSLAKSIYMAVSNKGQKISDRVLMVMALRKMPAAIQLTPREASILYP